MLPAHNRRRLGNVVHVAPSRSGLYWAILKDTEGERYFAFGKSFLTHPRQPRVGWSVEFTALPPAGRGMPRATEISTMPRSKRATEIAVVFDNGKLRVILRGEQNNLLGELRL